MSKSTLLTEVTQSKNCSNQKDSSGKLVTKATSLSTTLFSFRLNQENPIMRKNK